MGVEYISFGCVFVLLLVAFVYFSYAYNVERQRQNSTVAEQGVNCSADSD